MSDADRNVALLKDAYKKWGDSLGASVDEWMKICADQISFGSIAEGRVALARGLRMARFDPRPSARWADLAARLRR